jgi:AcrR family transcriptional regulator
MTTTSRPLRADAERNRRRILAAAREVFARRGLDAGLDEIAKHAGVGTATVYRRFPDKEALVTALFAERLGEFVAAARTAAGHPDPWLGLTGMLETAVAMQIEDRGLRDVLFAHKRSEAFAGYRAELEALIGEIVGRAVASGDLRPDVAFSDLATVQLMVTETAAVTDPVDPQVWRRYLRLLLDGLCTRRDGPSPLGPPPLDLDAFEAACRRP